jgi:hypothetical protein
MTVVLVLVAGCGGGSDVIDTGVVSMSQGRWGHSATLLEDGRVLVVGGDEKFRRPTSTAEIYDLTGTWSSADSMVEKRGGGHTATLLADGRVLVVGGSNATEVYDPSAGTWSSAGSMDRSRSWHTAALLEDGRVLIAGGEDSGSRKAFNTAEIYDPSTNEWSFTGEMTEVHTRDKTILLDDGKVLMMGKELTEIYDPATGEWSSAGKMMKKREGGYAATKMADGRVLVTGGETLRGQRSEAIPGGWFGGVMASHDAFLVATPKADIYDPVAGVWSVAAGLNTPRKLHPSVLLPDGKVLVVGSETAEIYDPAADVWTEVGTMLVLRTGGHTATLLGDGRVLILGGNEGADPFNPATNNEAVGVAFAEFYDPAIGWE